MKTFIQNLLTSLLVIEESEQNLCSICTSYESLQKENLELQKLYEETVVELEAEKARNADLTKANLWYVESNKNLREKVRKAEKAHWTTENYALVLAAVAIFKTFLEMVL